MTDCSNIITTTVHSGESVMAVYLGMTSLDRKSHRRLMHKIKSFGIIDPTHSQFTSYLSSSNQVTRVPFLLHNNNVFSVVRHAVFLLLSDDTKKRLHLSAWGSRFYYRPSSPRLIVRQNAGQRMDDEFRGRKNCLLCYKGTWSIGRFETESQTTTISNEFHDQCQNYPCGFSFSERTVLMLRNPVNWLPCCIEPLSWTGVNWTFSRHTSDPFQISVLLSVPAWESGTDWCLKTFSVLLQSA